MGNNMNILFHDKPFLADMRKVSKAQFLRRWCLVATILASVGCGDNREADIPAKPHAIFAKVDAVTMPPAALGEALSGYLDRLVNQVDEAGRSIITADNSNESKRYVLRWRMLTEATVLSAIRQKNSMLGLVETWAWVISMERYFTVGGVKDLFKSHQEFAIKASAKLTESGEQLVVAVMGRSKMEKLRVDIQLAVGNGEQFTATTQERNSKMNQVFSVTKMESVWGIAMSPFDALSGVGKGSDAMADLVKTTDRAVTLAERYPRLLGLQMEMTAIELQEQEASRSLISDVNRITVLAEQLPTRMREETQKLLSETTVVQAEARATLAEVRQAADALEKASTQTTGTIQALDTFVTNAKGPADPPGTPPGEPFRIQDYTSALEAATRTNQALQLTLVELQQTVASPALQKQITVLRQEVEAMTVTARTQVDQIEGKVKTDLTELIDRVAWITAGLIVLAAIASVGVIAFARRSSIK